MLCNAVGGGGGARFPGISITKVYCSTLLALQCCLISRKKGTVTLFPRKFDTPPYCINLLLTWSIDGESKVRSYGHTARKLVGMVTETMSIEYILIFLETGDVQRHVEQSVNML